MSNVWKRLPPPTFVSKLLFTCTHYFMELYDASPLKSCWCTFRRELYRSGFSPLKSVDVKWLSFDRMGFHAGWMHKWHRLRNRTDDHFMWTNLDRVRPMWHIYVWIYIMRPFICECAHMCLYHLSYATRLHERINKYFIFTLWLFEESYRVHSVQNSPPGLSELPSLFWPFRDLKKMTLKNCPLQGWEVICFPSSSASDMSKMQTINVYSWFVLATALSDTIKVI